MSQQKHVAQLQSLVRQYDGRARLAKSPKDARSFCFSFWMGVAILLQDQLCLPSVVGGFKRLLNNLLETEDFLGYIEACTAIREELVQHGSWDRIPFKELKPRRVRGIRSVIEHTVESSLIAHPSRLFDVVATFLGWLKRLPICIRDPHQGAIEYLENDRVLSSISFDDNGYVELLEKIWYEWLNSFELSAPFLPRHGPGSTADCGKIRSQKWERLSYDRVACVCLRLSSLENGIEYSGGHPSRMAKVVFVPKQAGKDRTICMEPAWLQFLQQGVARQLLTFTHEGWHPLSKFTDVASQERNRILCARAWEFGYSTIDLSNASDSVSWRLMKRLTRRIPLARYLYGTRSSSSLLEGTEKSFDKFAPMGSALCFPIECILFASVVELAYRIHYGQASKGYLSGCSVYGDDIICPSEIYGLVTSILQSLGFTVNASKSFSSGGYYESCGVEYLYGVRINTIRHPRMRIESLDTLPPESVGSITDLANTLLLSGYTDARRLLLVSYQGSSVSIGHRKVPFMDLVRFGSTHCESILPSRRRGRWNSKLHCSVGRERSLRIVVAATEFDFLDWESENVPRSRQQRQRQQLPRNVVVDERWSVKGVTYLARFRCWDLLEKGDVQVGGVRRTGRLHYKLGYRYRSLWQAE